MSWWRHVLLSRGTILVLIAAVAVGYLVVVTYDSLRILEQRTPVINAIREAEERSECRDDLRDNHLLAQGEALDAYFMYRETNDENVAAKAAAYAAFQAAWQAKQEARAALREERVSC